MPWYKVAPISALFAGFVWALVVGIFEGLETLVFLLANDQAFAMLAAVVAVNAGPLTALGFWARDWLYEFVECMAGSARTSRLWCGIVCALIYSTVAGLVACLFAGEWYLWLLVAGDGLGVTWGEAFSLWRSIAVASWFGCLIAHRLALRLATAPAITQPAE